MTWTTQWPAWITGWDYGNVPDWIAAVSAAGAAIGALLLLRLQGRQIERAAAERHSDEQARTRELRWGQARAVHVDHHELVRTMSHGVVTQSVAVGVHNNSAGVLNHVRAVVWLVEGPLLEQHIDLARLLPGEKREAKAELSYPGQPDGTMGQGLPYLTRVTFTDAAGVPWQIDHEHRLTEVSPL